MMSSTAELLVAADTVLTLATGPIGIAANLVGTGAYAAYSVVRQLQQDYQSTLQDLHAQCETEQRARDEHANAQRDGETTALLLVAYTGASPAADAEVSFVRGQVSQLAESAPANSTFAAECQALLQVIDESPAQLPTHLISYLRLREEFTAVDPAPNTGRVEQELTRLRAEIMSPLLDAPDCASVRAQLLAQLDQLGQVAVRQQVLARQGISLLRRRVQRELQTQAEARQTRRRQAEETRVLAADCLARLRAVSNLPDLPEQTARATALQSRLADIFTGASAEIPARLQALSHETAELFAECVHHLNEKLVSAYVGDQVAEVLGELGYQVSHVESASTTVRNDLFTQIDADFGIEFHVQGNGRLSTEMVALTEDALHTGPEAQEKICAVVDQVVGELRERQLPVRERFRSSLVPGQPLRLVEAPVEVTIAMPEAPKQQRMEMDGTE